MQDHRFENWQSNEIEGVPHLDHDDLIIRIGRYTERIHVYQSKEANLIHITYEQE